MPLVYVTGLSGAGKSSVCDALVARGYRAHGVDEEGFRSWSHIATGSPASEQRAWEDADVDWRARFWLTIDRGRVEELASAARRSGDTIFFVRDHTERRRRLGPLRPRRPPVDRR